MLIQDPSTSQFWNFNVGHIIEILTVILLALGFNASQRKERQELLQEQTKMHVENSERLQSLLGFRGEQEKLNKQRDEQISLLREQNARLSEMSHAQDRRLRMLEDDYRRRAS